MERTMETDLSYHAAIDGKQDGPFDFDALGVLIKKGKFDKETLVWKPGMVDWMPAGQVAELAPVFAPPPPPPAATVKTEPPPISAMAKTVPPPSAAPPPATNPEPKLNTEDFWKKNTEERKEAEAKNKDSFYFDGSLIKVTNGILKSELYIDGKLVDQWKSVGAALGIAGKKPVLKAENYPFRSGPATVAVYFSSYLVMYQFKLTVNIKGDIYELGKYEVDAAGTITRVDAKFT